MAHPSGLSSAWLYVGLTAVVGHPLEGLQDDMSRVVPCPA